MKYIKIFIATLSLLSVTGCGPEDKDKKGRATLEEISTGYGCRGLTNNGKSLICGTSGGTIVSINPYTGEASEIYDVDRSLNTLAYMGYDKYLFSNTSYEDFGYNYTFDIHKKLKNTLSQHGTHSWGSMVYDENTKLLYSYINGGTIQVTNETETIDDRIYTGVGGEAMAQTDKYIYIAESWTSAILQYSKNELLRMEESSKDKPTVVSIDYKNSAYYDKAFGVQGMTIFRGELFIYYTGDGMIHKLDVNLLDYDDSVDVKMRT